MWMPSPVSQAANAVATRSRLSVAPMSFPPGLTAPRRPASRVRPVRRFLHEEPPRYDGDEEQTGEREEALAREDLDEFDLIISDLTDEMMHIIISLVPTKSAVRTSVVSK